jgi:hypothetical protein
LPGAAALGTGLAAAPRRQPKRSSSGWRTTRTQPGDAMGVAFRVFRSIGCRLKQTVCWDGVRRDATPRDPTHAQHAGAKNVSRSFHAHREPQQSTRFGPPRNNSFSRPKDGTILMRLPSARGGACTPPAATPLRLTPMGSCRIHCTETPPVARFPIALEVRASWRNGCAPFLRWRAGSRWRGN